MGRSIIRSLALAAALVGGLPSLAMAQDLPGDIATREGAVVLEPRGAWTLDMRDSKCRLARWFGSEEDPHLLVIEQAAPHFSFSLMLGGSNLRGFSDASELRYGLERDEQMKRRRRFATTNLEDVGPAVIISAIDIGPRGRRERPHAAGIDLAEAATIDRAVLESDRRVVVFETGAMRRPVEALNACTFNLLAEWGLDPEAHRAFLPPRLIEEEAVEARIAERYPRSALRRGDQGIVRVRVMVEPDGSVSECVTENASDVGELESPACEELRKAAYEPGRDADGNAIRSFTVMTVNYKLNG